jgi:hypothetical protein
MSSSKLSSITRCHPAGALDGIGPHWLEVAGLGGGGGVVEVPVTPLTTVKRSEVAGPAAPPPLRPA